MPYVVTLSNFTPPRRYDGIAWQTVEVQSSLDALGPWVPVESFDLATGPGVSPTGIDADPSAPAERDITTDLSDVDPSIGWFRVVFHDGAGGVAYSDPIGPSGYPSTEALVAQSTVMELTTLPEIVQDSLRTQAIRAIEHFCGQQFTAYSGTVSVTSPGGGEVYLPQRLRSVTSITYGSAPMELTAISVDAEGKRLVFDSAVIGIGYYEQALYEVSGGDYASRFPRGILLVAGEWGWDTVPDAVVSAIRMDMEDQALADANALTPTVNVARKLGLTDVSQGNLRVALGPVAGSLTPRVMRVLEPYVFYGSGGHLV